MLSSRTLLLLSIALLCFVGVRGALGWPAAFARDDFGEFSTAARIGNIVGFLLGVTVWFGLALAQWARQGRWSLGVGIYALVVLLGQVALLAVALASGRVAGTTGIWIHFVFYSVLPLGGLAMASFVLRNRIRDESTDTPATPPLPPDELRLTRP